MQSKIDKIINLEIALEDARNSFKAFESNMSHGEKVLKKKTDTLERNLEQLTLMYHQLLSQKSMLKVDKQINERKIQRLNEKCQIIEDKSNVLKSKLMQAQQQIKNLQSENEEVVTTPRYSVSVTPGYAKIKKTIKGGGGIKDNPPHTNLFPEY